MIRLGILGYGNLGRGVEKAVAAADDITLAAVFTRRDPKSLKIASDAPVYSAGEMAAHKDDIDVLILCGGSANDLPEQTPDAVKLFNVVDSFDTHARIPEHFANVDRNAKESGKVGIISIGWDPGLFSLMRLLFNAVLPDGKDYTFWGKGVSQGHSDAARRVEGVADARQYTVPVAAAVERVRKGEDPELTTREKHTRECYVVAKEGADKDKIAETIKNMPNYYAEYDTTVNFITEEEMKRDHSALPHGGCVIRSGRTGDNHHTMEFSLKLDSNPEFTSSVLLCYARAAYRLNCEGASGAKTIFDIPPAYLINMSGEEIRAHLL
ncbi:MAG: diaminopimelate dehydrogenase [Oscillospiraceae bacterium]|nr:diaminopimelate dehydrogenase [Oscillospiraceae bacterium]MBQ8979234.1 diaminopimelate dehydrogenase [Oscillospiraceae bacterium]